MGAGRLIVMNVPNPAVRTSSFLAGASPIVSNTASTAPAADDLVKPIHRASRSAICDPFILLIAPSPQSCTVARARGRNPGPGITVGPRTRSDHADRPAIGEAA